MKHFLLLVFLCANFGAIAQQLRLKKGTIVDSIKVQGIENESFALYLPKNFDTAKEWPILFVFDMKGRGRRVLGVFKSIAEKEGYVLAASNNVSDSLSISENIVVAGNMFNTVFTTFSIQKDRIYTAGFSTGGRFATIIPAFIKNVKGVVSCGAGIHNMTLLDRKNPFHFIGIVGNEDLNYPSMLSDEKTLNKMKFANQLIVYSGGHQWPKQRYLQKALQNFTLMAMAKGNVPKDDVFINRNFNFSLKEINEAMASNEFVQADKLLANVITVYRNHKNMDSLRNRKKALKKQKTFKAEKRRNHNALFKESLIKEDFVYYLEEDVLTYNFNNLGWWNYQMETLEKYNKSVNVEEQRMGKRLLSYVNALIEDNIDVLLYEEHIDEEGLNFLWMLKTITAPKEYMYYLKIISDSAKNEDFGTALFYLEEVLKKGYTDKAKLYALEHTALLRIAPGFNEVIAKYLKGARYDAIEE